MEEKWKLIPLAMQRQLLIQLGLSSLNLVLGAAAFVFFTVTVAVPFLLGAALLMFSALRLYRIAVEGQYLVLKGVILKVERTLLRLRAKALLLEVEGKALRVVLRNRRILAQEGERVILYIADTTPLYEWRGLHQLHTYLALIPERQCRTP